jgi:hypothetical protein
MHKRSKLTGKGSGASFVQVPHRLLNEKKYCELSPIAVKLLFDLYAEYRGSNNGDFSIAWRLMQPRGWKSKQTLYKARNQLLEKGFLVQTRFGGRNYCSLYAVTWQAIDECNGKLEIPPTRVAPGTWKSESN